ncbi:20509_t:CDS:1, partial [Racocetra persica]
DFSLESWIIHNVVNDRKSSDVFCWSNVRIFSAKLLGIIVQ